MNEQKKRPLSISSLSSSSSSTSSLHRPVPKKLAVTQVSSSNSDNSPTTSPNRSTADVTDGDVITDDELASDLQTLAEDTMEDTAPVELSSKSIDSSRNSIDSRLDSSRNSLESSRHSIESRNQGLKRESSDSLSKSVIDRVVEEIMETERTYVQDMLDIIQGYLDHIVDQPTLIMSTSEIEHLFGNIREIYAFNRELLARLEECCSDPVSISQCFVDHNDGFIIYTQYCTNYPQSMEILTKCMRQSDLSEMFKSRQHALRQPLPLGSYLLKPVQRILKYHLLMQNMLDNSHNFSGESGRIIRQAYDGMSRMANHINEMKRQHEHQVRIQEVQSLLNQWDGEDLTTYGELLIEDSFRICGSKGCRHLFLFNKALLVTKKRDDGSYTCKNCIMCSNLMLIESIQNEPLNFHVIPFDNPKLQTTLQAKNTDHKRKWCHEIKRLIIENYNAVIPEKARNLVMNLGGHHGSNNTENVDPAKRHAVPEYLDRRRTRRKSVGIIPAISDFPTLMRSQRGRKSNRKSEVYISSPRTSPPMSRKLSLGDIGRINMQEIIQTSQEFDRSRRGIPNGRRPRPRSRSFDCGATLDMRRGLSESTDASSLDRNDEKRSSLPRDQKLEVPTSTTTSRLSELSKRYSFKLATKLNRVDSTNVRDSPKRKTKKKQSSVETMDCDSDTDDYPTLKRYHTKNGARDDPYLSLEFLRRAKDVILRRKVDDKDAIGRSTDAVSAEETVDTADTDSVTSSLSDHRQSLGSTTSLQPGAYDNLTFGRAFDAHMRRLADTSDDDILFIDEEEPEIIKTSTPSVNRSQSFSGHNGVNSPHFPGRVGLYERYVTCINSGTMRSLSSPVPETEEKPTRLSTIRSISAENSPLRLPCSRTIGSISSVDSESSTPRSNQDICWTDLEEYIANASESRSLVPKFPVLEVDLDEGQELKPAGDFSTDCLTLKPKKLDIVRRSSPLRRKKYEPDTPGSESEDEEKVSELERKKKHMYELTRAYNAKMKLEKSREIARELEATPAAYKRDDTLKRSPRTRSRDIILGGVSQPVSRQASKEPSPERSPECLSDSESQGIDTGEEFIRGLESLVASECSMNTSMAESTASIDAPSTDGMLTPPSESGQSDYDSRSRGGHTIKETIRRLEREKLRNGENNAFKMTLSRRGRGSIVTERVRSLERSTETSPKSMRKFSDIYRDKYLWDKDKIRLEDSKKIHPRDRLNHSRCWSESELLDSDCKFEASSKSLMMTASEVVHGINDQGLGDDDGQVQVTRGYVRSVVTQFQHPADTAVE